MTSRRYRLGEDGKRHAVDVRDGVEGFWSVVTMECTGCFEGGEYMGLAHHYDYDGKAGCHVGNGCDECGYTGKRRRSWWQPFDLDEAASLGLGASEVNLALRRCNVGDRVRFQLGAHRAVGTVVEDRGLIGVDGRQIVRIQAEGAEFELPAALLTVA